MTAPPVITRRSPPRPAIPSLAEVSRAIATTTDPRIQTIQQLIIELLAAELERDVGPTEPDEASDVQDARVEATFEAFCQVSRALCAIPATPITDAIGTFVLEFYLAHERMHRASAGYHACPDDLRLTERRQAMRCAERSNLDLRILSGALTAAHAQFDDPADPAHRTFAQAIALARACGHLIAEAYA